MHSATTGNISSDAACFGYSLIYSLLTPSTSLFLTVLVTDSERALPHGRSQYGCGDIDIKFLSFNS